MSEKLQKYIDADLVVATENNGDIYVQVGAWCHAYSDMSHAARDIVEIVCNGADPARWDGDEAGICAEDCGRWCRPYDLGELVSRLQKWGGAAETELADLLTEIAGDDCEVTP